MRFDILLTKKNTFFFICFFVPFIWFYLWPTFLDSNQMKNLMLLPAFDPIGVDLKHVVSFTSGWIHSTETEFSNANIYPPLSSVLFLPFLLFSEHVSYVLMFFVSLSCLFFLHFFLVGRLRSKSKIINVSLVSFFISLFTYPLLFELERGQTNLLAFTLAMTGLYFFHFYPKGQKISYFLLFLGVQIKLFPLIFVLGFKKEKDGFLDYVKRIGFFLLLNVVSLLSLGKARFIHFFSSLRYQTASGGYIHEANHSIRGFFGLMRRVIIDERLVGASLDKINMTSSFIFSIQMACYFLVLGVLIWYFLKVSTGKINVMSGSFLLCLTVISLLLPGISHDYKICYLFFPLILMFSDIENENVSLVKVIIFGLILFFYSTMLWHFYDHKQSSVLFRMNTPSLVLMLSATWLMSMLDLRARKLEVTIKGEKS